MNAITLAAVPQPLHQNTGNETIFLEGSSGEKVMSTTRPSETKLDWHSVIQYGYFGIGYIAFMAFFGFLALWSIHP